MVAIPRFSSAVSILMLELQGVRSSEARSGAKDPKHSLADLATRPDSYVDQLVAATRDTFDFVTIFTPPSYRLFFPSSGIFAVAVDDPGCPTRVSFAIALPISPTAAVATICKGGDTSSTIKAIVPLSVGIDDKQSKVVVDPELLDQHGAETFIPIIEDYRAQARELMKLYAEKRQIVIDAYGVAGIHLELEFTGRFRLPVSAGVGP